MKTLPHRLPRPAAPMPDLAENSESEDDDRHDQVPSGAAERVFPSLPDSTLRKLAGTPDRPLSREQTTDQEIENRFAALSLAFKTDRFTLPTRTELLRRHRDTAEENVETELRQLRTAVNMLNRFVPDPGTRELFVDVQRRIEVVQQSVERLFGKSELYGAVQQEERLSRAVEVMTAHVENLKRLREKERGELEETRRLLLETRILSGDKRDEAAARRSPLVDSCGSARPPTVSRRRASVAGYHRAPPSDGKSGFNSWILLPGCKPPEFEKSAEPVLPETPSGPEGVREEKAPEPTVE